MNLFGRTNLKIFSNCLDATWTHGGKECGKKDHVTWEKARVMMSMGLAKPCLCGSGTMSGKSQFSSDVTTHGKVGHLLSKTSW